MPSLTEVLDARGIPHELISHPRTYTSIQEARALGVDADEVAKTVVLDAGSGHAIAVIPASRRLDMRLVREALGDPEAHLATEREIEHDFPTFELGALPPLGSLLEASMYVDPELMAHDVIVFAAGIQTESVRVRIEDLFRGEDARVVPLTSWSGRDGRVVR